MPASEVSSPPPSSQAAAPQPPNAASLLLHAAHPLRLRILLLLGEQEGDSHRIARALGVEERRSYISQQLAVLRAGALVAARHEGRQRYYHPTEAGLALVRVMRSSCSRTASRQGGLGLLPGSIKPGIGDAPDPTSPDGLAVLLKAFADPLRLRVLNLLAVRPGVCICHLHEALAQPERSIGRSLAYPKSLGLILEEQAEDRPWFRLARPMRDLYRSLLGCFGDWPADTATFRADRERLDHLAPCTIRVAEEGLRTR